MHRLTDDYTHIRSNRCNRCADSLTVTLTYWPLHSYRLMPFTSTHSNPYMNAHRIILIHIHMLIHVHWHTTDTHPSNSIVSIRRTSCLPNNCYSAALHTVLYTSAHMMSPTAVKRDVLYCDFHRNFCEKRQTNRMSNKLMKIKNALT